MSSPRLPKLVWVFLKLDRAIFSFTRLLHAVRNELLWAWVAPEKRDDINAAVYANEKGYLHNGHYYRHGLFDWETKALTTPPFPRKGRILLGGAGGGREIEGIAKLGFEVTAFEPSETLLQGAAQVATKFPGCIALKGSYKDFLEVIDLNQTYAGFVVGWGSFSHLLTEQDRLELFQTFKKMAPTAPILLSFLTVPSLPPGKTEKIRTALGKLFGWMGRKSPHTLQDVFLQGSGFIHLCTLDEVKRLASNAGYEMIAGDLIPYPHAVLKPN